MRSTHMKVLRLGLRIGIRIGPRIAYVIVRRPGQLALLIAL